jgi:hypothetical protein
MPAEPSHGDGSGSPRSAIEQPELVAGWSPNELGVAPLPAKHPLAWQANPLGQTLVASHDCVHVNVLAGALGPPRQSWESQSLSALQLAPSVPGAGVPAPPSPPVPPLVVPPLPPPLVPLVAVPPLLPLVLVPPLVVPDAVVHVGTG